MNKDIIFGKWMQFKGKVQVKWGDLIDDDFKVVEGNVEYLVGWLQEWYGWVCDCVENEVCDFEKVMCKDYLDFY